jgi:hypothetical protein
MANILSLRRIVLESHALALRTIERPCGGVLCAHAGARLNDDGPRRRRRIDAGHSAPEETPILPVHLHAPRSVKRICNGYSIVKPLF